MSEIDQSIFKNFDYTFDGYSEFQIPQIPTLPKEYNLGVIVGSSGSGKSSLLNQFGKEEEITWDRDKSLASHFESVDDAINKLTAVGLNTIPTWGKPRNVLSNGEGFRADLARKLKDNSIVDEYSSVVNRDVAKSCSVAFSKYIKRNNLKNIIVASCHFDILDWLEPDWVYNTDTKELLRGGLRRPSIQVQIYRCGRNYWEIFKNHHYLTDKLPPIVKCYIATWENKLIGFASTITMPANIPGLYEGDKRKKWRACRTVVFPDFQGFGIGTRLADTIGDIHLEEGVRFFSKTSHMRMGEYRNRSPKWRATSTNQKKPPKIPKNIKNRGIGNGWVKAQRVCYSHEYIGENNKSYNPIYNFQSNTEKQMSLI